MLDKESYIFKEVLRDGTRVILRAALPHDGLKIRRAFRNLRRETSILGFLALSQT
jgi:hypothetical protein